MRLLHCWLLLLNMSLCSTKRHPRASEVRVVNECPLNIKLRCQSILTDHSDRFIGPREAFRFKYYDFEMGNRHFWCDVYALNQLNETFDVSFGTTRERRGNMTWLLRPDGLYSLEEQKVFVFSTWTHTPHLYIIPIDAARTKLV